MPVAYVLNISTGMQQPDYHVAGSVAITVNASVVTDCVVLHAHGLNITVVQLAVGEGEQARLVPGAGRAAAGVVGMLL